MKCPMCGQALPPRSIPIRSADHLVAAMRVPPPPSGSKKFPHEPTRDVYEIPPGTVASGRFYVTFRGGETTRAAIEEALERGLIHRKYEHDGYWCLTDVAK